MARLLVPTHLLRATPEEQLEWLSRAGGLRLRRIEVRGKGLQWIAELEGHECGGWGPVLAKALHELLTQLQLGERVAG